MSFRGSRRSSSVIPRRSKTILCQSEEVADRRRNLPCVPPAGLPPPLSPRVFAANAANSPPWSSAANAEKRPWSSFCPPTRQRFRPFRALYRTRLHPDSPQRHIFRICGLASSLAAESSLHPACRPANKPFAISGFDRKCSKSPPGLRPQMQQIGLVGHSARRRGNDSAHFGRFTGRVCNRTALRGTFSAFAAGQVVWPLEMASQLSCRASTSETWSPVLWTMFS